MSYSQDDGLVMGVIEDGERKERGRRRKKVDGGF